jgi:hypothetical protein
MIWTRPRIALQACLAVSALAMLYVGVFQIGWLKYLACPGFRNGCVSVALAEFSRPLGFADGLLRAAYLGAMLALAQVPRKEAALAIVAMAAVAVGLDAIDLADMHKLGAWSLWNVLSAALSTAALALAAVSARQPFPAAAPAG